MMDSANEIAETFLNAIDMTLRSAIMSPGDRIEMLELIRDGVGQRMEQIREGVRADNWGGKNS